ncbi:MAG: hypothetical protein JWP35_833 [Caulobacter sp.]|nr:hypothetical protein [Caulobacter sp.]
MNDHDGLVSLPDGEIRARLMLLRQQHQDLDSAVSALEARPRIDQLQIARLKRQKLLLKDQITQLENQLRPDIIA